MIIYLISYCLCFIFARLGWFLPSGLVLMLAGVWLYWKDYRASGNLSAGLVLPVLYRRAGVVLL